MVNLFTKESGSSARRAGLNLKYSSLTIAVAIMMAATAICWCASLGLRISITNGILIVGRQPFITQTCHALNLLDDCSPNVLSARPIRAIIESGTSGVYEDSRIMLAADETAFDPGFSRLGQLAWYAGVIGHEARHVWQYQNDLCAGWDEQTPEERASTEADARGAQLFVLVQCVHELPASTQPEVKWFVEYLMEMQNGSRSCVNCGAEDNQEW